MRISLKSKSLCISTSTLFTLCALPVHELKAESKNECECFQSIDLLQETNQYDLNLIHETTPGNIHLTNIQVPEALNLSLHFTDVQLPEGSYMEISDPSRRAVLVYAANNIPQGGVSLLGDTAMIKIVLPGQQLSERQNTPISIKLGSVDHEKLPSPALRGVIEQDQRRPLVCYQDTEMFNPSLATVQIASGGLGTGSSIGTGNFYLTNRHMVSTEEGVKNSVIYLNYWYPICDASSPPVDYIGLQGEHLLATSDKGNDLSLFSINDFDFRNARIKELFGSLAFAPHDPVVGDAIYIPQHGSALPMLLGERTDDGDFSRIIGVGPYINYNCDTTGGSSGSPVISREHHHLVGLHCCSWGFQNGGPSVNTLHEELDSIIGPYNQRVEAKGKFKPSLFDEAPFVDAFQITFLPGVRITPFEGISIEQFDDHAIVKLESLDMKTGELGTISYRLFTEQTPEATVLFLNREDFSVSKESVVKAWLPLEITDQNNHIVENHLVRFLNYDYDPFFSPFAPGASVLVSKMNIRTNADTNIRIPFPDRNGFGFVALYTGEGPTNLVWTSSDKYSKIRVPVRNQNGDVTNVYLRGYHQTGCSSRPINNAISCQAIGVDLYLEYRKEDNTNLISGTWSGILPLQGLDWKPGIEPVNILIEVEVSPEQ